MISNCGIDERGMGAGGQAGDQTGGEYAVIPWWNFGQNVVLRHPTASVRTLLAKVAKAAANNNCIGYDQADRLTYYKALMAARWRAALVSTMCESDCSASTCANVIAVGHRLAIPKLTMISPSLVTWTMRAAFHAAGWKVYTAKRFLTSDNYLLPGDIILCESTHVAINLSRGRYAKEPVEKNKTVTDIAREIIAGMWGPSGPKRRQKLKAAGYDPVKVAERVRKIRASY